MLDLDALVNVSKMPHVRLCGRTVVVRPMSGESARRIAAATDAKDTGATMLAAMLDAVAMSVPELSDAERASLTVEQVAAVITVMRGGIEEVEQQIAEQSEKN